MAILSRLHAGAHPDLTAFFSLHYLALFLPACIFVYVLTPKKWKKYTLLAVSLGFYWLISGLYIGYLLASAALVWALGLWIDRIYRRRNADVKAAEKSERKAIKKAAQSRARLVLTLGVVSHIGLIGVLKYSGFFLSNVNLLLGTTLPVPEFVKPLGLSFFILQAVSYLVDVYREVIPADRNVGRITLFLCFFPQIVEGPICRYGQTAEQLWNAGGISYVNLTMGLQRILYGLMKKLLVADRLNPIVNGVFVCYEDYSGGIVFLGAVLYTIQLYMDFSGSMDAVLGTAQIFGIAMPENFRRPFFSRTVSEFWTRWHISLGTWFKDYIFYPVTMSGPMKSLTTAARKKLGNHFGPLVAGSIALFCVWLSNGLWHGAAWTFVAFGMYHFCIILTGNVIAPYTKALNHRLNINPERLPYRLAQTLRTCVLVVFGELIFRANSMTDALAMLKGIFTRFRFSPGLIREELLMLLQATECDVHDLKIVLFTVALVFVVSLLQERGLKIRESIQKKPLVLRWAIWYALILLIVIFGAYGVGYVPVDPMYANF